MHCSIQNIITLQLIIQLSFCINFLDDFQLNGKTENEMIELPLKDISIKIDINNNLAFYTMSQTYINSDKLLLETIYHFPYNNDCIINNFTAIIGEKKLIGIVKEKNEAREEYEKEKAKGNTVIYSEIVEGPQDIMKLQIGNIYPGEQVVVEITFIEKIKIKMNKFWEFRLFNTLTERYGQQADIPFVSADKESSHLYSWNIFVNIQVPRPLNYLYSPSHENELVIKQNENKCEAILYFKPEIRQFPDHDFIIQYNTQELHKPIVRVAKFEQEIIGQFSFIPDMLPNSLETSDEKYSIQEEEKMEKIYQETGQGEFLFIIDRSGSMTGDRIENLKKALKEFLEVLPINSYFNIINFGSSYDSMFSTSQKYTVSSKQKAIQKIKYLEANYGGTEMLNPLQFALTQKKLKEYPRFIFLLTDGDIWDTNQLLQMAKNKLQNSRIYTIGIGNGVSTYLIQELARIGNGKSLFAHENDNLKELATNMVRSAVSPFLYNFQLIMNESDSTAIKQIVPNPETIPFILKDEEVTFYLKFNSKATRIPIKLQFQSSVDHQLVQYEFIFELAQIENSSVLHKMMYSILINQLLSNNLKESKQQAIKYALKYQILCSETAIILVEYKNLSLSQERDYQIDQKTVQIPSVESADYHSYKHQYGMLLECQLISLILIFLIIFNL